MVHIAHRVPALALLLATAAGAQVAPGAPAPVLEFDKVWNDGPKDFDQLAGRVVLLDFAQTW